MTKRCRVKRSNKPVPEGASGYAAKRRTPWHERHRTHTRPVYACPYCFPDGIEHGASPSPLRGGGVDMAGVDE